MTTCKQKKKKNEKKMKAFVKKVCRKKSLQSFDVEASSDRRLSSKLEQLILIVF